MITYEQALALRYGQYLYSLTDSYKGRATGTPKEPVRVRVTGRTSIKAGQPGYFKVPLKYGMRTNLHLSPSNAHLWTVDEAEAKRMLNL